jgi:hypothetical protein
MHGGICEACCCVPGARNVLQFCVQAQLFSISAVGILCIKYVFWKDLWRKFFATWQLSLGINVEQVTLAISKHVIELHR